MSPLESLGDELFLLLSSEDGDEVNDEDEEESTEDEDDDGYMADVVDSCLLAAFDGERLRNAPLLDCFMS